MRLKKQLLLIFALSLLSFTVLFAGNSQVTVSISKLSGYIGEPFEIKLILKSQTQIDSIKVEIKEEGFEVISKTNISTENTQSYKIFQKKIAIVFWKTGNFKILPIKVKVIKDKKIIETLETNQLEVTINSSLKKKENTEKDLNPLKPLAKVLGTIFYFLKYLFLTILLIVMIILIFIYIRKKIKQKRNLPIIIKSPVEEFNIDYVDLEKKNLIMSGKIKLHFLKLTEITKKFLNRQYSFNAGELTTFETIMAMKKRESEQIVKEKFDHILSFSDKVKFAKFIPKTEELDILNSVIKNVSDVFLKRQAVLEAEELKRIEKENAEKNN